MRSPTWNLLKPCAPTPPLSPNPPGELLPKLLSVTRRHLSHILNAGTDQALLAAAGAAAAAGRGGPSVSQVFVQPDGKQLQEVSGGSSSSRF